MYFKEITWLKINLVFDIKKKKGKKVSSYQFKGFASLSKFKLKWLDLTAKWIKLVAQWLLLKPKGAWWHMLGHLEGSKKLTPILQSECDLLHQLFDPPINSHVHVKDAWNRNLALRKLLGVGHVGSWCQWRALFTMLIHYS